jgi:hypothetical protein
LNAIEKTSQLNTRKPLHIFCVLAVIGFLMSASQDWLALQARALTTGVHVSVDQRIVGYLVWQSLTALTLSALNYGGLGLIVELIDRIRWSSLPETERAKQRSRYILARLLRLANAEV